MYVTNAPEPPTELGRYRCLAPKAGVMVSPLQLGGLNFGDAWQGVMGETSREGIFKLLDAYAAAGGNVLDTANVYQDEQSEKWIGEWITARDNRDRIIIATKYTAPYTKYRKWENEPNARVAYMGNSRRSLHLSVRDSLKKLQTDFIDILYVHYWDWTVDVQELMDSLHILVEQGKVLYLGISNTPAWIVAEANSYANAHGKTPFSVYQGRWNIIYREMEREIVPMCRRFGMAIAPWDAIGGGKFRTKKQLEEGGRGTQNRTENEIKMAEALEKVAQEHGIESPTAIALAWLLQKTPYVFPIIGTRKVENMLDNTQALKINLTPAQVEYLESIVPFSVGYPADVFGEDPHVVGKPGVMAASAAPTLWVPAQKAIQA